jgi:hypothetical protein
VTLCQADHYNKLGQVSLNICPEHCGAERHSKMTHTYWSDKDLTIASQRNTMDHDEDTYYVTEDITSHRI